MSDVSIINSLDSHVIERLGSNVLVERKTLYTVKTKLGKWPTASKWAQRREFLFQQRETLLVLQLKARWNSWPAFRGCCLKTTCGSEQSSGGSGACGNWAHVEGNRFLSPVSGSRGEGGRQTHIHYCPKETASPKLNLHVIQRQRVCGPGEKSREAWEMEVRR